MPKYRALFEFTLFHIATEVSIALSSTWSSGVNHIEPLFHLTHRILSGNSIARIDQY